MVSRIVVSSSTIATLVNNNTQGFFSLVDYFSGEVDDVRIYDRVLSAEEIWALQSQGAS